MWEYCTRAYMMTSLRHCGVQGNQWLLLSEVQFYRILRSTSYQSFDITQEVDVSSHCELRSAAAVKSQFSLNIFTYTYGEPNQIYSVLPMPESWILDPETLPGSLLWHCLDSYHSHSKERELKWRRFCGLLSIYMAGMWLPSMATKALFKLVWSQNPQHLCTFP